MSLKNMKTNVVNKEKKAEVDLVRIRDLVSKQNSQFKQSTKRLRVGIEGEAKTGKTGLAMDCDKTIYYLDCDGRAVPTWKVNYEASDRIVMFNPVAFDESGNEDAYTTQGNIRSFIALAQEAISNGEDIRFVWDGVDAWLNTCTLYMTGMENARIRAFKPSMQQEWYQRNQPFRTVLDEAWRLDCDQIYITHVKPPFRDEPPQPVWNKFDYKLDTIVGTSLINTMKGAEYSAYIKSANYSTELVGKRFTFLSIPKNGEVQWKGLTQLKDGTL
jgi:hypothetical protein